MESTQLTLLIDKRNIRWFKILIALERTSSSSATELAALLQTTNRTIISDIKEIKTYFNEIITIDSSKKGYHFELHDKIAYMNQKKKLLEYEPILIILSDLFYGKILSISEWANQFFLTEQTLRNHLKKLNPILTHYQLKLTYPILELEGKEINIRNFFLAIFYEEDTLPHYVFPPDTFNNIINNISHTDFEHFHLNVPRFRFSYLLFISYQRIVQRHPLQLDEEIIQILSNSHLNNTMKQINTSFKLLTSISLTPSDLSYIFLMIVDSNSYNDILNLTPIPTDSNNLPTVLPMILEFCEKMKIYPDDETVEFIRSFFYLNYLKNKTSITCLFLPTSIIHYYKKNYKEELKLMADFITKYTNLLRLDNSAQFEYTLLLFSMRLVYKLKQKNYKIAFLFEGSIEATVLLEDLTKAYIPSNHTIYFLHADTPLDDLITLSIDLVVTNFSEYITYIPEGIDYLLFNYHATAADWNKLIKYIDPRLHSKYSISLNPFINN